MMASDFLLDIKRQQMSLFSIVLQQKNKASLGR